MTEHPTMARDPVCGAPVDRLRAPALVVRSGETFYFCSARCKATFLGKEEERRSAPRQIRRRRFVAPAVEPVRLRLPGSARPARGGAPRRSATRLASEPVHSASEPTESRAFVGRPDQEPLAGRRYRRRRGTSRQLAILIEAELPPVEHTLLVGPLGPLLSTVPSAPAAPERVDETTDGRPALPEAPCSAASEPEPAVELPVDSTLPGEPAPAPAPGVREVVLQVSGMTCPSCALRIERAVGRVRGVISCSANVALGLVIVGLTGDSDGAGGGAGGGPASEQPVLDRIERLGYRGRVRRDVAVPRQLPLYDRGLFLRFGVAAVVLATIAAMGLERPHSLAMAMLGLVALLGSGGPILFDALWRARFFSLNSSSLIAVGALVPYLLALNQAIGKNDPAAAAPLFEGAVAVVTAALLGQLLRRRIFDQLLDWFHRLLRLAPALASSVIRAQVTKGRRQLRMDRVVRFGVPATLALVAFLGMIRLSLGDRLLGAVIPSVTVIAALSFTALGLAAHMATMIGSQRAALRKVVFREAGVIDDLARLSTLVTTKSVVAQGTPLVQRAIFFSAEPRQVLALVAGCEAGSNQPAGRALYDFAIQQGAPASEVSRVQVLQGYGLRASADGRCVSIGSRALMERDGVALEPAREAEQELAGMTVAYMALDGVLVGVFALMDRARPGVARLVGALRGLGIKTVLVTGDPCRAADAMARQAGMEEVLADIPPSRRAHEVSDSWGGDGLLGIGGDPHRDGELLQVGDLSIAVTESPPRANPPGVWLARGTFADLAPAVEVARRIGRVSLQNSVLALCWSGFWAGAGAVGLLGTHGPVIAGGAAALLFSLLSASSRVLLKHRLSP